MLQTPFNDAQLEILQLFSQGLTDIQLEELRETLIEFRSKLLDKQVQKTASEKGLTINEINKESKAHRRSNKSKSNGNQI